MDFFSISSLEKRKKADALVLPLWQKKKVVKNACNTRAFDSACKSPIETGDFLGKEGEIATLYIPREKESRIILLGLGEFSSLSVEVLRRAYAKLIDFCNKKASIEIVNVLLPSLSNLSSEDLIKGISQGMLLANYSFDKLKRDSLKKQPSSLIKKTVFIGANNAMLGFAKREKSVCEGVYLARDLVNDNANTVTPKYLASIARRFAKDFKKVKATIFDKKHIEKEGMNLFLAVAQGSSNDPAFIVIEYRGNPKSKDCTVLVGKGVTHDSGGMNLKPSGSIETMKSDMAGAAMAIGTLQAVASLGLKINLTVVIAAAENSIGSRSYKPGDVYQSYLGKTVEIGNTDAEGRLTLADALAYAEKKLSPTRIVDFATLTGAVVIALGHEVIGMMSNNDKLAQDFIKSGEASYERVCRFPLYEEYREQLKSSIADLNNIGGRPAGSITAGMFLKEFITKTPWIHLDIAATAYLPKSRRYHPKNATGSGVRLMMEFLYSLTK